MLQTEGIFNFNDDKIHNAEIIVTDAHHNKSVLSFSIKVKIKWPWKSETPSIRT